MSAEAKPATQPTMQDLWRDYRDKVYPEPIPAQQSQECHQAFYAGALALFTELKKSAQLPEGQAEAHFAALEAEIVMRLRFVMPRAQKGLAE